MKPLQTSYNTQTTVIFHHKKQPTRKYVHTGRKNLSNVVGRNVCEKDRQGFNGNLKHMKGIYSNFKLISSTESQVKIIYVFTNFLFNVNLSRSRSKMFDDLLLALAIQCIFFGCIHFARVLFHKMIHVFFALPVDLLTSTSILNGFPTLLCSYFSQHYQSFSKFAH